MRKIIRRILLIGAFLLLLIVFAVAFLLYSSTLARFNIIMDGIDHTGACIQENTLEMLEHIGNIKELSYNLLNANTLTFLLSLLGAIMIGLLAIFFKDIETKLGQLDKVEKQIREDKALSEITAKIQYNVLNLKGCLITKQFTNIPEYLSEITDDISTLERVQLNISDSLLRRMKGTVEELEGMIEKNMRKERVALRRLGKTTSPSSLVASCKKALIEFHTCLGNYEDRRKTWE